MKSTKKGFTLVELLVVIAILAILATVSVVGYTAFIEKAHQSVAMQEMTQIRNALVAEDITNELIDLSDGIDGTHQIVVASTEGAQGSPSEAEIVLNFVNDLGIAGIFRVSNKQLQFSPAGKDATATCDFVTGEITTAKGAIVVPTCEHANTAEIPAVPATCTETGLTAGVKCADCGHIITAQEEVATIAHTGGTATCSEQAICTICEQPYGDLGHSWNGSSCENCDAEKVTMQYVADTTTNMGDGNNATSVGLNASVWTITATKGACSNNIGLNKDDEIRLYANKADGNGNVLTVSVANGTIESIVINTKKIDGTMVVTVGENVVEESEGSYIINATEFSIANKYVGDSSNTQILIESIEITFILDEVVEPQHTCESKCPECQGCLDAECTEEACDIKCDCEEDIAPEHTCTNLCEECGKCTNAECEEAVCADKCQGHVTATPANYTYTFKSGDIEKEGGDHTISDYTWNISESTYIGWDGNATKKGIQIGSSNNPTRNFTLETDANGELIKKIIVNASTGSGGDAKLEVYVNGEKVGNTITLTTTATSYTFTLDAATIGNVEIKYTATTKGYYIQSITILGE